MLAYVTRFTPSLPVLVVVLVPALTKFNPVAALTEAYAASTAVCTDAAPVTLVAVVLPVQCR